MRLQFLKFGTDLSSPPTEGYLVATTGRYLFLWEPDTHQRQVIRSAQYVNCSCLRLRPSRSRRKKHRPPRAQSNLRLSLCSRGLWNEFRISSLNQRSCAEALRFVRAAA